MRRVSSFSGVARGLLGSSPQTTGVRGSHVENPWFIETGLGIVCNSHTSNFHGIVLVLVNRT